MKSSEVAAYIDRTLSPAERDRVEVHLAECEMCRKEALEIRALLETQPRRRTRWISGAAVLAAAAVVAILLIRPSTIPVDQPILRAPETQNGAADMEPRLEIVRPRDGETVEAHPLTFMWRTIEPDALYRFTLTDAQGDIVWSATTGDSTLTIATEAGVQRDTEYYWYVDALLSEGRSTTTGVYRITTLP